MKMYIAGQWVDRDNTMLVLNPFDQSIVDTCLLYTSDAADE